MITQLDAQTELRDDLSHLFHLADVALEEASVAAQLRRALTEALAAVARSLQLIGEDEETTCSADCSTARSEPAGRLRRSSAASSR